MPTAHSDAPPKLVTLIPGDGIGPEVVRSAQAIIAATGVAIEWEEHPAGASVFRQGLSSGVPHETVESARRTGVVLKGPLETPIGFGEKSANVTLRKLFETYANIRPVRELPGVETPYSGRGIDLVVVRENVEDLYAGIEYMQTPGVAESLKLISRKGCEKIVRMAFEFARSENRHTVHCATKSNIMKFSEGLLKHTFEEIAPEYPDIEPHHIIIDNCAHQLVKRPEQFDVIVTTNMNGDIISDLSSALVGGLGFAPSANIGNDVAIFEAVHGSAPKYAGKNTINPTALILTGALMLRYLNEVEAAAMVEEAVLLTLASGVRTRDIAGDAAGASTTEYTEAIISHLGEHSTNWTVRGHRPLRLPEVSREPALVHPQSRHDIGVDVFIESELRPEILGPSLEAATAGTRLRLETISNRGTQVYPATGGATTDCIDHWPCRFLLRDLDGDLEDAELIALLARVAQEHRWVHIERLAVFDGERGFTKAQGED
ncbi:MAG TPA: NADP-dependent isocitrate dehydrogenase [Candidatus Dormibacteraeota bacterium]